MAVNSLLARIGIRFATLGSAASLVIAAPVAEGDVSQDAHTHANRTGVYFPTETSIGVVVQGTEALRVYDNGSIQLGANYTGFDGMPDAGPYAMQVTGVGAFGEALADSTTALHLPPGTSTLSSLRIDIGTPPSTPVIGDVVIDADGYLKWSPNGVDWKWGDQAHSVGLEGEVQFFTAGFLDSRSAFVYDVNTDRLVTPGLVLTESGLPLTPLTGQLHIDAGDLNILKWWDGTSWNAAGSGGGAGTPGGADTEIQYNASGSFGGIADFTYVPGTNTGHDISLLRTFTGAPTGSNNYGAMKIALDLDPTNASGGAGSGLHVITRVVDVTGIASTNGGVVGAKIEATDSGSTGGAWNGSVQGVAVTVTREITGASSATYGVNISVNTASNNARGLTVSNFKNVTGSPATVYACDMQVSSSASGTISDARGVNVAISSSTGTITDAYGVYVGTVSGANITNAYGVYQSDSAATNRFFGLVSTPASTTTRAGLRIAQGTAPTTPVNGDVWCTSSGPFMHVAGVTNQFVMSVPALGMPTVSLAGTYAASASSANMLYLAATFAPAATTASTLSGISSVVDTTGVNGLNSSLYGVSSQVNMTTATASAGISEVYNGYFKSDIRNGYTSGTTAASTIVGGHFESLIRNLGAGSTWNVNEAYGMRVSLTFSNTGTINVTNSYALHVSDSGNITTGTRYGVYQSGHTNTINHFGSPTYFGTSIGVGIANASSTFANFAVSTTAKSSLRIGHGVAPTTPVAGDVWTTTTGFYMYLNGTTVLITTGLGVPSSEASNRALTDADNGKNLICTGSLTITVNTGLVSGFGCSFKGTVAFTGSATVTDVRTSGATNPWCAICATGTDTYDIVGSKV